MCFCQEPEESVFGLLSADKQYSTQQSISRTLTIEPEHEQEFHAKPSPTLVLQISASLRTLSSPSNAFLGTEFPKPRLHMVSIMVLPICLRGGFHLIGDIMLTTG